MNSTDESEAFNEKRLIAAEIIRDLYEAGKAGQLLLLKLQIEASLDSFLEGSSDE